MLCVGIVFGVSWRRICSATGYRFNPLFQEWEVARGRRWRIRRGDYRANSFRYYEEIGLRDAFVFRVKVKRLDRRRSSVSIQ